MENEYKMKELPGSVTYETIRKQEPHQEITHWHDGIELIRVLKGNLHCHVNESGFLLNPDEVCFINQSQMHRIYGNMDQSCEVEKLSLGTSMLAWNPALYNKYIKPFIEDDAFAHIRMDGRNSHAKRIIFLMEEISQCLKEKPEGYELEIIGNIHLLCRQIYLLHTKTQGQVVEDYDLTLQKRMVKYIQDHYSEKIGLMDIAESAGISRSKCTNLFNFYTDSSPVEYLNRYRLEMAAQQLRTSKEALSNIAFSCGFSQQSYFSRMFVKEFGMTPLAYRKQSYSNL